jgi:hypothetical protein
MNNVTTYRSRTNYVFFVLGIFLSTGILADNLIIGKGDGFIKVAAISIAIALASYVLFLRPKILIFDEGITITNMLSEVTVGWHEVEAVETRYCMSIQVADKVIYAVAAPAPGRYHSRTVHESELRGISVPTTSSLRPGDSPRSQSGIAAHLARTRMNDFFKRELKPTITYNTTAQPWAALTAVGLLAVVLLNEMWHWLYL